MVYGVFTPPRVNLLIARYTVLWVTGSEKVCDFGKIARFPKEGKGNSTIEKI
jgi:hypothetical protein